MSRYLNATPAMRLFVVCAVVMFALLGLRRGPVVAAKTAVEHLSNTDAQCARCHADIYTSYSKTAKAQGSGEATDGFIPGDFTHAASGIRYRVFKRDESVWLSYERSQASKQGPPISGERRLDYFVGSSKRARTYLFSMDDQADSTKAVAKLWYETPINWYSKRKLWDMAPAREHDISMPITQPVDASCLHCHAGNIQTPLPQARNAFLDRPFASAGVGCASCHGNAEAHIASNGKAAIINPAKLGNAARDSICLQCHLEGDAVVYRQGHSLSSFKPGEDLSNTAMYFINRSSPRSAQRAVSQWEALLRSACRRAIGDRLTCTNCHDPHSSPAPEERVAFFRAKCVACHTAPAIAKTHHPEQQDCAVCHMPTRTTADISHEQMTDHDIERRPRSPDATAPPILEPLESESKHNIDGFKNAVDLVPVGLSEAPARERGLAYAQFAARGDHMSAQRALSLLRKAEFTGTADIEVHEQIGFLLQSAGKIQEARKEYAAALAIDANRATANANVALIDIAMGDAAIAIERLARVVQADGGQTSAALNLAFIQCENGQRQEAYSTLLRALQFNPDDIAVNRFIAQGEYAGHHCSVH